MEFEMEDKLKRRLRSSARYWYFVGWPVAGAVGLVYLVIGVIKGSLGTIEAMILSFVSLFLLFYGVGVIKRTKRDLLNAD